MAAEEPQNLPGFDLSTDASAILTSKFVQKPLIFENVYPRLGLFLDSDDNFIIYRRFGFLHARLLLEKQYQLRSLEEELYLDSKRSQDNKGEAVSRHVLFKRIEEHLGDYCCLLQAAYSPSHFHRPPSNEFGNIRNFVKLRHPLHKPLVREGLYHPFMSPQDEPSASSRVCSTGSRSSFTISIPPRHPLQTWFWPDAASWPQQIAAAWALGLVPGAEALPASRKGTPMEERASEFEQFGMSLAGFVAVGMPVAGLQYGACKLIDYGAQQKTEEERAAHKANSHLAWSLTVSFGNLYLIRDNARAENPMIFYTILLLNVVAVEIFREYQFAYFSGLGFGHRALSLGLGTAIGLMLYALNLVHCVPLAFWASIAAPPYLVRMARD